MNKISINILLILMGFLLLMGCEKEPLDTGVVTSSYLKVPEGFPAPVFPPDNQYSNDRWELGKKLFFDPILSKDSTLSCGSCHKAQYGFADRKPFSPGVGNSPGTRNASTLTNVAYNPYFVSEGSVPTLEMQILVPIQERNEFDHNIVDIVNIAADRKDLQALSQKAYGRSLDPFVITRSISVFERTLISGNSLYDQYQNGDLSALSQEAVAGNGLFFGKAGCSNCHGGFNFTDYSFKNNGLDSVYTDVGRMRFTNDSSDYGLFKVPTLRNIELTAPYMHNAKFVTLQQVVEHYNSGGQNFINKSSEISPLNLSEAEKNQLIAFLMALTDNDFAADPRWVE